MKVAIHLLITTHTLKLLSRRFGGNNFSMGNWRIPGGRWGAREETLTIHKVPLKFWKLSWSLET